MTGVEIVDPVVAREITRLTEQVIRRDALLRGADETITRLEAERMAAIVTGRARAEDLADERDLALQLLDEARHQWATVRSADVDTTDHMKAVTALTAVLAKELTV